MDPKTNINFVSWVPKNGSNKVTRSGATTIILILNVLGCIINLELFLYSSRNLPLVEHVLYHSVYTLL